jgi:uncharacterized protein (TIGR03000 family)
MMMAPAGEPVQAPKDVKDSTDKPKQETNLGNQARVIVQMPTDALLLVDGQLVNLRSSGQPILTPELQPDRDYYYIVRAQAVRDGATVEDARRVIVRAGHSSRVTLDLSAASAQAKSAAQPARITVRVPEDAKLSVDGTVRSTSGDRRTFVTPELEPGKAYYYEFKADFVRDGESRSQQRRVVVEAGKNVTVDLRESAEVAASQR